MRLFILLLSLPLLAHAWGPIQANSIRKVKGMDWHWIMSTPTAKESLELDCQSFIHNFHHNKDGKRVMSVMLDEVECEQTYKDLRRCFPLPGKACVKGTMSPTVSCGKCP